MSEHERCWVNCDKRIDELACRLTEFINSEQSNLSIRLNLSEIESHLKVHDRRLDKQSGGLGSMDNLLFRLLGRIRTLEEQRATLEAKEIDGRTERRVSQRRVSIGRRRLAYCGSSGLDRRSDLGRDRRKGIN